MFEDVRAFRGAVCESFAGVGLAGVYEQVFRASPLAVSLTGVDHCFISVNDAFRQLLGYSESELQGTLADTIIHPEDRASDDLLADRLTSGELTSYQAEKRFIRKTNQVIRMRLTAWGIHDGSGHCAGIVTVFQPAADQPSQAPAASVMASVSTSRVRRDQDMERIRRALLDF